ncbi:MAG: DUF2334 domain-containing protein [Desulfobulbaceae bacterium]|nr:MAG: DUF2334 domain-containing protein [Desulfobulbaceae bacterium]
MKYVVFRDDDTSHFTKPAMLETLYRPLLDAGKSVGISVIPAITGGQVVGPLNGPFWDKFRLEYSPCLPPEYRKEEKTFPLTPNSEIVEYIKKNNYEILQHGFQHTAEGGIHEGMLKNTSKISQLLNESQQIMNRCFGKASEFFVVPWDDASKESLKVLRKHFKGVSLNRVGQRHVTPLSKIRAASRHFVNDKKRIPYFWDGEFLMLEHPGPVLSMFNNFSLMKGAVAEWLDSHDLLILVNHYWEFFWDWNIPNLEYLETWHDIVHYLLDRKDVEIISFSQLYEKLRVT